MDFLGFPKIGRLSRDIVITEKLDGTNAQIHITEDGGFHVGSRKRWISVPDDHFGFAYWAHQNKEELMELGPGQHFGEWWGQGIQRKYGLTEKRFSLFNVGRWNVDNVPACCDVVPTLYTGEFSMVRINLALAELEEYGSAAAPGFMNPEGIVIFHTANGTLFKKTIKDDEKPKGIQC